MAALARGAVGVGECGFEVGGHPGVDQRHQGVVGPLDRLDGVGVGQDARAGLGGADADEHVGMEGAEQVGCVCLGGSRSSRAIWVKMS